MNEEQQTNVPQKSKAKRIVLLVLLVLLCLVCILVLTATMLFHKYYSLMNYESVDESIPSLTEEEISAILDKLYGDESVNSENEMQEDSRAELDNSMDQIVGNVSSEESEETSSAPESSAEPSVEPEEVPHEKISNVLVIGLDREADGHSRSDVMIVVSINEETGRIALTSLLRDTYLTIPGYPNNRLNAAYAFGGVSLLQKTIKQNFDIEIDRYITVDFEAFTTVINILGGIELELTDMDCKNVFPGQNKPAGKYNLNAEEALTYTRWRKGSDDFDRTSRQRTVMLTVIRRMLGMSLSELTSVMEQTLPLVSTDLTEADCYSILFHVVDLASYEFSSARIPYPGTWEYATIDGRDVITVDLAENRRLFYESTLE